MSSIYKSSSYSSEINPTGFDKSSNLKEQEKVEDLPLTPSPLLNTIHNVMKKTIGDWLKDNNSALQKIRDEQVIDVCYGYIQNQTYEIAKAANLSKKNVKSKDQLHKKVKFSKNQIIPSLPLFTQDQICFIVQTTKSSLSIHFEEHFNDSDQKKFLEDEVNLFNRKSTKAKQTFHNLVEFGVIN
ncbi:MAG: hypothetical protein BGO14_00550 [Chlamydiales bacterium 38-26]|nr:hypothetical protein [Chlamydiales bacterium]OJV07213.1 MAG: hypothetical protein BGO14_00550 [Chlamydiales bacterium 38-26]